MNEWAAKLLSVFPERNKADLDEFIMEVNNDNAEQMFIQKEFDADLECRPSFEQLSHDVIISEINKNIWILKSLEGLVNDRMSGLNSLFNSFNKTRSAFEAFESVEGSLKTAFDAFFLFSEQEILQSKQHLFLSDLKRSLVEIRADAQRRLHDYQKEVANAEKDVVSSEKKLSKTKEQVDRAIDYRQKMESFELDILSLKKGQNKEDYNEEILLKYDREIQDDIFNLLKSIEHRDQVITASRRAFQKLDLECKNAIFLTLQKLSDKEKENAESHRMVVEKLDKAVSSINIDEDTKEFINKNNSPEEGLILSSQALHLLSGLNPTYEENNEKLNSPRNHITAVRSNSDTHTIRTNKKKDKSGNSPLRNRGRSHSPLSRNFSEPGYSTTNLNDHLITERRSFSGVPTNSNTISQLTSTSSSLTSTTSNSNPIKIFANTDREMKEYLSQVFYSSEKREEMPIKKEDKKVYDLNNIEITEDYIKTEKEVDDQTKLENRQAIISPGKWKFGSSKERKKISFYCANDWLEKNPESSIREAVKWIFKKIESQNGRDAFTTELNQLRSRKVDIGRGFDAVGCLLNSCLSFCQLNNDVRNGKLIMMLSQTFYRAKTEKNKSNENIDNAEENLKLKKISSMDETDETDEDGEIKFDSESRLESRSSQHRQFIKEMLIGHPLWEDPNFWEQALWQCALEQLHSIPYDRAWHDMAPMMRRMTVRRVHDVILSQLLALTHSMMELGCSKQQSREFLYRMCVIHQLGEAARQQLLLHLSTR